MNRSLLSAKIIAMVLLPLVLAVAFFFALKEMTSGFRAKQESLLNPGDAWERLIGEKIVGEEGKEQSSHTAFPNRTEIKFALETEVAMRLFSTFVFAFISLATLLSWGLRKTSSFAGHTIIHAGYLIAAFYAVPLVLMQHEALQFVRIAAIFALPLGLAMIMIGHRMKRKAQKKQ